LGGDFREFFVLIHRFSRSAVQKYGTSVAALHRESEKIDILYY
jgi:hypothetical protein